MLACVTDLGTCADRTRLDWGRSTSLPEVQTSCMHRQLVLLTNTPSSESGIRGNVQYGIPVQGLVGLQSLWHPRMALTPVKRASDWGEPGYLKAGGTWDWGQKEEITPDGCKSTRCNCFGPRSSMMHRMETMRILVVSSESGKSCKLILVQLYWA